MRVHEGVLFIALAASLSCSGRPEATTGAQAPSAAVAGSSGSSAKDDGAPALCPLVKGDPNALCSQGGSPEFLADVDAAIDELVQKRPELFNLKRVVGGNGYLVLSTEPFYLGVAAILQAKGFCAGWDLRELQVKNSQARSEQYDLIMSNGHLRRGIGSYRATCSPANFPLDPADVIARVRVGFYSIQCEGGRVPPRNGEGLLPVDCTGFVTEGGRQRRRPADPWAGDRLAARTVWRVRQRGGLSQSGLQQAPAGPRPRRVPFVCHRADSQGLPAWQGHRIRTWAFMPTRATTVEEVV
jgi:hypothetical protein